MRLEQLPRKDDLQRVGVPRDVHSRGISGNIDTDGPRTDLVTDDLLLTALQVDNLPPGDE
jgi:hypothetical protein